MLLNLGAIAERPLFVLSLALALIATKSLVIFAIGKTFGMDWRNALALGLLLSQGGEFGFVLFAQAQSALLVSAEAASIFSAVVTLSMIATPFLMTATRRMREPPQAKERRDGPQGDGADALIIGYGRFGQTMAQMLVAADVRVTLIDNDVERIDAARDFGAKVYFGEGTRIDLLRQAGAAEAALIAFCVDGDQITEDFLHGVHTAFPQAEICVRAFDRRTMLKLKDAPVRSVVREVLESAVTMARAALEALGVSLDDIDRAEAAYRGSDKERLRARIATGSLTAARDRMRTDRQRRENASNENG